MTLVPLPRNLREMIQFLQRASRSIFAYFTPKPKPKVRTILPYEYFSDGNMVYIFTGDTGVTYSVNFWYSEQFFDESCSRCRDILEVQISSTHNNPPKDYRVGATIFDIFDSLLSGSCNGIMYRCEDKDGRQCSRELTFERWDEQYNSEEEIERFAQTFCDHEDVCTKYFLLVAKGCLNYPDIVQDFNYNCKACAGKGNCEEE